MDGWRVKKSCKTINVIACYAANNTYVKNRIKIAIKKSTSQ